MLTRSRQAFNRGFDPEAARRIRAAIADCTGGEVTFPLSDTPIFVSRRLADELCRTVRGFFDLLATPGYLADSAAWVPAEYRAASGPASIPAVSQFDFAVVAADDGRPRVRMLECQGCSSLMGVVPWYGHLLQSELGNGYTAFLSHQGWEDYVEDLRRVLGDSVLVDVDAPHQKLRTDFWVLHRFAGVEVADLDDATLDDLERRRPRIYNRVVPIDAERLGRADLVQRFYRSEQRWAIHPEWYFRLSKRSLGRLRPLSELIPETVDLTEETLASWGERDDVVLKPANDFGGNRIHLTPGRSDLERALASGEPWVLQERAALEPAVSPPDGPRLYCDLRVLCLEDRPVALFCRLARSQLCNISFNGDYPWCGITIGLVPREEDGDDV